MTEFISRSYGQDEFEVIIKTDNKEHYKKAEDFSRKLIDHAKPRTNADRIRAMNDEELADFIANCGCQDHTRDCRGSCTDCVLEWLKQPAE